MEKPQVVRATFLIMAIFFLQPVALGGWLALIPLVKADLGLTKAELALALVGMPAALIPSLQIAGRVIGRFGPRRVARLFFPLQAVAILLPLLAWDWPSLFAALFMTGATVAFIEVAMNVYAGRLEKQSSALIMNRCHGFWALGLMTGSGVIGLGGHLPPFALLGALAAVSAILGLWASAVSPQLPGEGTHAMPMRRLAALPRALICIALFMLFVTLAEGAMADWAAVYLAERIGDPEARAGFAVTIFSGFMAAGRFIGDALKRRMGAVALARLTTGCAIAGLLLLVLPLPLWAAYPGFALVGFGISTAYPLGVSAVAALDDSHEASNIAFTATVALGGFLVGPPLIGFLAQAFSLAVGLAALLPGLLLAYWLTRWLGPESRG